MKKLRENGWVLHGSAWGVHSAVLMWCPLIAWWWSWWLDSQFFDLVGFSLALEVKMLKRWTLTLSARQRKREITNYVDKDDDDDDNLCNFRRIIYSHWMSTMHHLNYKYQIYSFKQEISTWEVCLAKINRLEEMFIIMNFFGLWRKQSQETSKNKNQVIKITTYGGSKQHKHIYSSLLSHVFLLTNSLADVRMQW